MIIGNPFMFAILVERVAEWNDSEAEDNGHFAFCIRGEAFPKGIINTPYIIALKNAVKALKNEPRKEVLMNDWIREAYETVYHRVFPNEEISKDWNSLYSLYDELSDDLAGECFYIFTVKRGNKTVFMAVEYTVNIETQCDILDDIVITAELDEDEINLIVREMETFICAEELRIHGKQLIDRLSKANEESEIEEISAYIADDARNKVFSLEQIKDIIDIYNKFDLLSMKYKTREQILYTLGEITNTYQIKGMLDLKRLLEIRDLIEDDLKEYVDEII